jgi:hypothetical protein
MAVTHKTAMGKPVDMDMLRLANEGVIAVGNMRTNARGDELGPGGKIIKTRGQLMKDYHKLNTPVADHTEVASESAVADNSQAFDFPVAEDEPVGESSSSPNYVKPRGSFADAVAQETEVNQELLTPPSSTKGIQRI